MCGTIMVTKPKNLDESDIIGEDSLAIIEDENESNNDKGADQQPS